MPSSFNTWTTVSSAWITAQIYELTAKKKPATPAEQSAADDSDIDFSRRDNEKNAQGGGKRYSMRDIDIERTFVDYSDRKEMSRRIDTLSGDLINKGKAVPVSGESADSFAHEVDWTDKSKVRELLRNILEKYKGLSVQFQYGEQYAIAYLTKEGINHAVGGPASEKKAAAFTVYHDLIRNAEYCFSSINDPHSNKNKKIPGKIGWDYFVAVARFRDGAYPVVFKIRTVDMDVRSQIYEIAATKETGGTHEDGQPQKRLDANSDYGVAPISGDMVAQDFDGVNKKFSARDTVGRELTAEQQEYFRDSKVRDEQGRLMVMYHGTPNGSHTRFRSGTYFTPNRDYADKYRNPNASMLSTKKNADDLKTYEVYLNITKPFDTRNPRERRIFEEEYYRKWGTGAPLADSRLPDWTDGMDLQEFIEEMGYDYDGLILDEGATGGYGLEVQSRGLSYVTFSPEQVKNADNAKPTNDPDIRFSARDYSYDALVGKEEVLKHYGYDARPEGDFGENVLYSDRDPAAQKLNQALRY